jgi:tetratricopeptide (TPR) repeat protein
MAAEMFWQKQTTELEQKVRQNPKDPDLVLQLASNYHLRGAMARSRPQDELDWNDKAIAALEPVLRQKASQASSQDLLFACYRSRADALTRQGRPGEALKAWDRALELKPWHDYHEMRLQRALTLVQVGEHAQAVAEADALHPRKDLPGATLYTFARLYSLAAAKCGADQALSKSYSSRAVALLALLKETGYFKEPGALERLQRDADFEAVRGHEDFKKLFGKN